MAVGAVQEGEQVQRSRREQDVEVDARLEARVGRVGRAAHRGLVVVAAELGPAELVVAAGVAIAVAAANVLASSSWTQPAFSRAAAMTRTGAHADRHNSRTRRGYLVDVGEGLGELVSSSQA